MLINVDGEVHRLFFSHDEVERRIRYHGRMPNPAMSGKIETIPRTTCKLEKVASLDGDGKRVWTEVGSAEVFLNSKDNFSKREGCEEAFRALLVELQQNTTKAQRAQIADQFRSTRPKKASYKDLKRENAALKARIAELEASVQNMLAEHNPA